MKNTIDFKRDKGKNPLIILVHAPLGVGGVTNLMLNIQRNIDRKLLNFDYLVFHDRIEPKEQFVYSMGSKKLIASADNIKFKPLRGIIRLFKIRNVCKNNNVKIFHFNGGAPLGFLTMFAAKCGGVKWITFHSHNGGMSNEGFLVKPISAICKPLLNLVVDDYWACSSIAARFSFPRSIVRGKKYYFMPNAIDLHKFKYNEKIRKQVRNELGLSGKFVIGHAGRFNRQKNHAFLIDIFAEIHRKDSNAVLVLFGVGELQESIKNKVNALELNDYVLFYGASNQMNRMYQAMDVFLMPSLFEGLPVVGVEAQAAGLPIVFSDVITREVGVAPNIEYLSLKEPVDIWANKVLKFKNAKRTDYCRELEEAGFDQDKMVAHFEKYYLDVGKKLKLI